MVIVSSVFVIWSILFIYRSSFIAIDNERYFCLFDDAMISMRYAWNFAHGYGLVWNQGEYIQGYTNLLMTLLMSLATLVFDKSTAVLFIQITGVFFMLAIAYVSMLVADHIGTDEPYQDRAFIRVLTFCCVLSYYPLVYWTLMGMETGLLTLLLLLSILFAFRFTLRNSASSLFSTSVTLGLAFLTRNDSIVFSILVWGYIALKMFVPVKKADRGVVKLFLVAVSLYAAFIIAQLLFQHLYYGSIYPNTYILKLTGLPLMSRIANGLGFVVPFLRACALILILSSLEVVFDFQKEKLLLISISFSAIVYQVYVGGDPWNYWRILSPSMPLTTILFVIIIYVLVHAISSAQVFKSFILRNSIFPEKYASQYLTIPIVLIGLLSANLQFFRQIVFLDKPYTAVDNQRNVNRAIALNQLTTKDATIGAIWAGATPYFLTDRKAIDFLGKSDKYIAQLPPDNSGSIAWSGMTSVPGHNKYDLHYSIQTLRPTYVPNFKYGTQDLSEWAKDNYVRVEYDGIELFLLKDSPFVYWDKIDPP